MIRLSVLLQQPLRDVLDMIARDRRTSLSQAVEYLIETVGRDYRIEGRSPFELVGYPEGLSVDDFIRDRLMQTTSTQDDGKPDFVGRRAKLLKRWLTMPASLRKPQEQYFCELHAALPGLPDNDDQLVALENSADWFWQNAITVDHASKIWREMMEKNADELTTKKTKS